jgi:DNA-3-methyladenine glycosylase II
MRPRRAGVPHADFLRPAVNSTGTEVDGISCLTPFSCRSGEGGRGDEGWLLRAPCLHSRADPDLVHPSPPSRTPVNVRRPQRATPPARALEHLRRADPVLGAAIDSVGPIELATEPDLWWGLVDSIISQQVSVKAAWAIIGRVAALGANGRPTPAEAAAMDDDVLRAAGLSRAKVRYVKDLATRFLDGTLRHAQIPRMSDHEVIAELTQVKGIGVWTAEMILIFTLGRPDVLPVDDLGIRVAVQRLYDLPTRPGRDELLRIAEPWRPWRSLASRYLWRVAASTPAIAPPAGPAS